VAALPPENGLVRISSRTRERLLERAASSEEPAFRVNISEAGKSLASRPPSGAQLATKSPELIGAAGPSKTLVDPRIRAYGPPSTEASGPSVAIDLFA
jgi:hypothetical protein